MGWLYFLISVLSLLLIIKYFLVVDENKVKRRSNIPIRLKDFIWILILLTDGLLIVNVVFDVFLSKVELSSPLSYSETMQVFIATFSAMVIAFLQFKIQDIIEQRNYSLEILEKENNFEKLKASRTSNEDIFKCIDVKGFNFNLLNCRLFNMKEYNAIKRAYPDNNISYVLKISGNAIFRGRLSPPNFVIKENNQDWVKIYMYKYVEEKGFENMDSDYRADYIKTSDCIYILFDKSAEYNILDDFFYSPAKISDTDSIKLRFKLEFDGEDAAYKELNSEEKMKLQYAIVFDVFPIGGYSEDGTFLCDLGNYSLDV